MDVKNDMLDYIHWRGDLTFEQDPFNEADALLFSMLSYIHFQDVVEEDGTEISIQDASEKYFSLHPEKEMEEDNTFTRYTPLLMKEMAETVRFHDVTLSHFVNMVDLSESIQMSAVVFHLPAFFFVSYRGTDKTIAGWKEDFNISYTATTGQKESVEYLKKVCREVKGDFMTGGHSKGGSFSVYASSFAGYGIQKRLLHAWSFDGPGLQPQLRHEPGYIAIKEKILKYVPEESMIGMIFSEDDELHVFESTAKGPMQHDAFTWKIMGNRMIKAEEVSDLSRYFLTVIQTFLEKTDEDTRAFFIDTLFSFFEATDAMTFEEIRGSLFTSLKKMGPVWDSLSDETGKEMMAVVNAFLNSMWDSRSALFKTNEKKPWYLTVTDDLFGITKKEKNESGNEPEKDDGSE